MSGIGKYFGITTETPRQQTAATAPTNTTLQALGPATSQILTPHHTVPGVPTPPRFKFKLLENYIAFKMEGVEDSPIHSSVYKKSVYKLFFGDEFSPIKTVAINYVPIAKDVLAWQPDKSALNFANEFMAEAAGYGIDGQVFCETACMMEPHNSFGKLFQNA
jgi:hypothetical protein